MEVCEFLFVQAVLDLICALRNVCRRPDLHVATAGDRVILE